MAENKTIIPDVIKFTIMQYGIKSIKYNPEQHPLTSDEIFDTVDRLRYSVESLTENKYGSIKI